MLSYRHAFHAGNFADVLKHGVLTAALGLLVRKDKPLCYLDTHAGEGRYDLAGARARRTNEAAQGIGRLWERADVPLGLQPYLRAVRAANQAGRLASYPGSPALAAALLRPEDRLVLMELNAADHEALRAAFRGDRRVAVHRRDGYEGLAALTPPAERRGLALLDPTYEVASDWKDVARATAAAWARWPGGCYAIWYPVLDDAMPQRLARALADDGLKPILRVELVRDTAQALGLKGSGMLLVNPPWTLDREAMSWLPWLAGALGVDGRGAWRLDWVIGE
jgi:23S rRNA (adenine2030-N6)-methyltransferase